MRFSILGGLMAKRERSQMHHAGRCSVAIAVGMLSCCAVAAYAVRGYSEHRVISRLPLGREATMAQPSATIGAQASLPLAKVETEIVTILPDGFEPTQITRPVGRIMLMVNNRSGLGAVTFRLDLDPGIRLLDVTVPRTKLDWVDMVDLIPGSYVLSEANHPDWVCHITITAH